MNCVILLRTPAAFYAILSVIRGYFLGVRQTRKQALSKYINETSSELYPTLFSEINENLEKVDHYLDDPNGNFVFRSFDDIYDRGLDQDHKINLN